MNQESEDIGTSLTQVLRSHLTLRKPFDLSDLQFFYLTISRTLFPRVAVKIKLNQIMNMNALHEL